MRERLAVLVPTFRGGALLGESVASVAGAGLSREDYEVFVVDNATPDDATLDALPRQDANGASIRLHRNPENLGRVGNWNHCLHLAETAGFTFAAFLFVGDVWLPAGGLPRLLGLMRSHGAQFGMGPNAFLRADRVVVATARRVGLAGPEAVVRTDRLLNRAIRSGALLFGPLQANVFRIVGEPRLRFDPGNPEYTDQEATVAFLRDRSGSTAIVDKAFVGWRAHVNRFHMSMDLERRVLNDLAFIRGAAARIGVRPDWTAVRTAIVLQYLNLRLAGREYTWMQVLRAYRRVRREGALSVLHALRLALRRLLEGRGLVHVEDF